MSSSNKQYGLLLPKKSGQSALPPRPSVFGDDSDTAEEGGDWVKKALKRESEKSLQKKQTKIEMERALAVDPTVYQYDEVYDKIEEKRAKDKKSRIADKKPRYIQSLLKQAERRKKEQERRFERDIQREREAEGEQFKDKESFVTSAYRAKLEEFRKMDEQERRMDHIEAIMDVSKQDGLGGFYRHLYRQATGEDPPLNTDQPVGDITKVKEEQKDPVASPKSDKLLKVEHNEKKGTESVNKKRDLSAKKGKDTAENSIVPSERKYRKRQASSSDQEESPTKKKSDTVVGNNKDKDESDSSSSSESSSEDSSDSDEESNGQNSGGEIEKKNENDSNVGSAVEQSKVSDEIRIEVKVAEEKPPAPKRNIWEKQTVGPVFDAALERYYARKAARLAI